MGTVFGLAGLAWVIFWKPARRPGTVVAPVLGRLALLGVPALGLLAFALVYWVADVATMLGPLVMILCIGVGGLVAGILELGAKAQRLWITRGLRPSIFSRKQPGTSQQLWVVGVAALVSGGLLAQNYALVDESWDRRGQVILAELACELSGTPSEVWLTAESGFAGSLVTYLGERIGRRLVWASPREDWDYLAALSEGRRVFLVKDMPGSWQYPEALRRLAGSNRYLLPTGSPDLLEIVDASLPPLADVDYVALDQPFGSAIVLRGYTVRLCSEGQSQVLRLTLHWEGLSKLDQNWRVKAQLQVEEGVLVAQADSEHPARGARPTTLWEPGQIVRDAHDFYLLPGADLSAARVVVGLYRIVGDEFPTLAEVEIPVGD
jgi:hypothetical protein